MRALNRHARIDHARCYVRALCCLSVVLQLMASVVHAAFAPLILVVTGDGLSPTSESELRADLAGLGEVIDDSALRERAREHRVDPASDFALSQLAVEEHARLIVAVARADAGVHVEFRDGHNGTVLSTFELPNAGKRLSSDERDQIIAGANAALIQLSRPSNAQLRPTAAVKSVEQSSEPGASTEQADVDASGVEPVSEVDGGHPLVADVSFGVGLAAREVLVPTSAGDRKVSTGLFPALDVGMRVTTPAHGHGLFGVRLRYQTSVGLTGNETPNGGARRETSMRSHRFEGGVLAGYRFSEAKDSVLLAVFAGWAARALRTVEELSLPAYGMHGPCLRPELLLPLGKKVQLRLAPELLLLAGVGRDLRSVGAIHGGGLGFGAEAGLRLEATKHVSVALEYRESHWSSATDFSRSFDDIERFATLQGVLQY